MNHLPLVSLGFAGLKSLMKLLFRGVKPSDEFLTDYIERLSVNNGYDTVNIFNRALKEKYFDSYAKNHSLRYKAILRVSLETILKRNIPIDEYDRFYNQKRGHWRRSPKICRSCWSESQYRRFYWWLRGYEVCHLHNERLECDAVDFSDESEMVEDEREKRFVSLLIDRYSEKESAQRLIIDEMDRCCCDKKIINSILQYFGHSQQVVNGIEQLNRSFFSGDFMGLPEDMRIEKIANTLAREVGTSKFWVRIIAFIVLDNKRGLASNFPSTVVSRGYVVCCRYILAVDPGICRIKSRIELMKEYREMNSVCINRILCEGIDFSERLLMLIKCSIFSTRNNHFYDPASRYVRNEVYSLLPSIRDCANVSREF
jgi:hypothetical protein